MTSSVAGDEPTSKVIFTDIDPNIIMSMSSADDRSTWKLWLSAFTDLFPIVGSFLCNIPDQWSKSVQVMNGECRDLNLLGLSQPKDHNNNYIGWIQFVIFTV